MWFPISVHPGRKWILLSLSYWLVILVEIIILLSTINYPECLSPPKPDSRNPVWSRWLTSPHDLMLHSLSDTWNTFTEVLRTRALGPLCGEAFLWSALMVPPWETTTTLSPALKWKLDEICELYSCYIKQTLPLCLFAILCRADVHRSYSWLKLSPPPCICYGLATDMETSQK